ncbi:uncharacterized protein [Anabrus simplex]|uniref:uncharacterized protein isoform X2 n=1 Tax=Anabrus simplex TaxID=316456 RepID=UPI0035A26504
MDLKEDIKGEPVWLEGTASTSLGNFEFVSQMILLKEETKSELMEPGPMWVNTCEPSLDVKDEVVTVEHAVNQPDLVIREGYNVFSAE